MKQRKSEIIEMATKMINEQIDLLDGCRKLVYLQRKLEKPPEVFLLLRGIDSETDIFPLDKAEREQWGPEALLRLDKEKTGYIF
ncbi:MAG: hypothetical protein NVS2B14_19220 [Chamaesiphon sp.]